MVKTLKTFYLSEDVIIHLKKEKRPSALVEQLVRSHFEQSEKPGWEKELDTYLAAEGIK